MDCIGVAEFVFETAPLSVMADELDGDFEELDVFVDVIEVVIVLVVVLDGLTSAVAMALRVNVVVLVDVLDCVLVDVDITTPPISTLPDAKFSSRVSLYVCGLKAMEPIAVNNRSQRIPFYI